MKHDEWLHLSDHDRIIFLLNRMSLNEEFIAGMSDVLTIYATMIATSEARDQLLAELTAQAMEIPEGSLRAQSYWKMIGLLRGVSDAQSAEYPDRSD